MEVQKLKDKKNEFEELRNKIKGLKGTNTTGTSAEEILMDALDNVYKGRYAYIELLMFKYYFSVFFKIENM